jgi:hypothetical protein
MNNEKSKDLSKQESVAPDPYKEKELLLKEREIDLKELELKSQLEINRRNIWFTSPVLIGLATVIFGSLGTALFQGYSNIQLERQKFEFSLILKALESRDKNLAIGSEKKEAAKRLSFLVDLGVIKTLDSNVIKKLAKDPNDLPDFSRKESNASAAFSCKTINGVSTTLVRTSHGDEKMIEWRGINYPNGLSANEQCEIVSRRFRELSEKGYRIYLKTERMNGRSVICATDKRESRCEFKLFEVSSSVDPKSVLKDLIKFQSGTDNSPLIL